MEKLIPTIYFLDFNDHANSIKKLIRTCNYFFEKEKTDSHVISNPKFISFENFTINKREKLKKEYPNISKLFNKKHLNFLSVLNSLSKAKQMHSRNILIDVDSIKTLSLIERTIINKELDKIIEINSVSKLFYSRPELILEVQAQQKLITLNDSGRWQITEIINKLQKATPITLVNSSNKEDEEKTKEMMAA